MSYIYAISDIHGCYDELLETLKLVDLDSNENILILLGDYVSRGHDTCKVLYHIKSLEEKYSKHKLITLLGNHDELFIDWYTSSDLLQWFFQDTPNLITSRSFITSEQFEYILRNSENTVSMNKFIKTEITKNHSELLRWFAEKKKESRFYETKDQIFVHAGICEEDEELWKYSTSLDEFTCKYPAETGAFYKNIIAGHIWSDEVANDSSYLGKVFWDKFNHFYIDGNTIKSGIVPLLKYDTELKMYFSYYKCENGKWIEYNVM